jgi:hypothetical protein
MGQGSAALIYPSDRRCSWQYRVKNGDWNICQRGDLAV